MTAQQSETHDREIINQFTLQADAFAEKHASHEAAFQLALEVTGVTANDTVLDVACGPGLITCAFAQVAQHVVGADLTPAMLERARRLQTEKGLHNLNWHLAAGESLPYRDGSFSLVISRYSFHHFLRPNAVLAEMMRVGRSGAKVAVIDVICQADKVAAFNRMEKLRDPSHVRAMPIAELIGLLREAGLTNLKTHTYTWEVDVEKQLRASFPLPGDEEKLRQIFLDDLTTNALGMGTHRRGSEIYISYPTMIIVGEKAT
jgi:ubiquinone/menaquinone biosynthesis C-methylase UbiE